MFKISNLCLAAAIAGNVISAVPTSSSDFDCEKHTCRFKPSKSSNPSWSKWDDLKNLVVFGASYTAAGDESQILNAQPPYKDTSCGGPNYIDFLVNGQNKGPIKPKSYAVSGSPVSSEVLGQKGGSFGFVHQVDEYLDDVKKGAVSGLSAKDTLYSIHFGINDIGIAGTKYSSLESKIFDTYSSTIEKLYQSGARNFIVLNVPPIDRSPGAAAKGATIPKLWQASVISWNTHVTDMISTLGNKYPDAVFFRMGMNGLFSAVLDNVAYSEPTKTYKDTTQTCTAYSDSIGKGKGVPSKDYKSPQCAHALDEYFWAVSVHPTWPMHETVAIDIANALQKL